jgi:diguanylate cyclase (GGDEF)-like protein
MMPAAGPTSLLMHFRRARRLPSPPGTAIRVLELARREDTDIHEIADVVTSDPVLSSRLLRYANSSLMGVRCGVTSVRNAVLLLGLRPVKLTALGFSLADPEFEPHCPGFDLRRFWADSFATAAVARRMAELFKIDREEAFTAGLLAGIGRLALAHGLPEEYKQVLRQAHAGRPLLEAERDVLGADHVRFGAQLLEEWGLPEVLVQATAQQGEPSQAERAGSALTPLAQVVQCATRAAPLFSRATELTAEQRDALRQAMQRELRLGEPAWQQLVDEVSGDFARIAELFAVELTGSGSVLDLYAEAQEEVARVGMVAQLERAQALEENKALLRRATTDALTDVANRAKFDERLAELVKGLRRGHGHFALVLFDIDHFKAFNDAHGHDVGDLVLKHVACAVFHTLRDTDLLARYGGEEFAVLAPCTDRRGACIIAARVCKSVERHAVTAKGKELRVTVSAGLALTSDYAGVPDAARFISDADKQLYLSKHAGRNTWSYLGRSASNPSVVALTR